MIFSWGVAMESEEKRAEWYSGPGFLDSELSYDETPLDGVLEMGERKKRQVFSAEFKAKVGLEAIRGLKTVNELGQEYGVHPVQISQWKKAILDQSGKLFEGKRGPKPLSEHQDPERLYGEIGRLKMELDWLKKKSGISLP